MGLCTGGAAVAIGSTVAAAFPLSIAAGAGGRRALGNTGALPVVGIWARPAVDIVLTTEAADVSAFVQGKQRVGACSVALLAVGYQFFAGLATKLGQPVTILALARTVPVLRHMREDTIAYIALARAILLHLEEV